MGPLDAAGCSWSQVQLMVALWIPSSIWSADPALNQPLLNPAVFAEDSSGLALHLLCDFGRAVD